MGVLQPLLSKHNPLGQALLRQDVEETIDSPLVPLVHSGTPPGPSLANASPRVWRTFV